MGRIFSFCMVWSLIKNDSAAALVCGLFGLSTEAVVDGITLGLACPPVGAEGSAAAALLYSAASALRQSLGAMMEEIDNGMLSEAAANVAALVAPGMFSGVRQPGGILAAAILNATREKRMPLKVPGSEGAPPPEAGADATAGNVLSPRMQALNALQARFDRFVEGQAAPRAIDFGAAAEGIGGPPPAKPSLAGLAVLKPSAEAPWEMDCKVQLLKNLGGIPIVRKINGAVTGKMLDEKDPLVDLDAAGAAAAAHGCDIDFDIVYKRAQAIYANERPQAPPLCFDTAPKTWAEAIVRLHLILRIHSGGEGSTTGNGALGWG